MEQDDGGVGVFGLQALDQVQNVGSLDAFKMEEVAVAGGVVLPARGRLLAEILACGFGCRSHLASECRDRCGGFFGTSASIDISCRSRSFQ